MWDGEYNINFLVKGKGISFVSFSPKNHTVTIIDIPDKTFLEVSKGFGKWQLSSIFNLGQTQNEGAKLLKSSLSNLFGLPIEGLMDFSEKTPLLDPQDYIEQLKGNPLNLFGILSYLKTDLTPLELIRLQFGLSSVRFDKAVKIDLEGSNALQKTNLADGTEVFTIEDQILDSLLTDIADPAIKSENITVAVFNSTDHPLLAQKAGRIITNLGADVIILGNSEKRFEETLIYGEESKTLKRLWQIFGQSDKINSESEEKETSRAQINVFLGEDFFTGL